MEVDQEYFSSYGDLNIHKIMLEDEARNAAYHKAIFENKEHFEGATVLDVGSGTGILSIFCAQAGAKQVFAVEKSDTYKISLEIIKENGFENTIQVINDSIEAITSLPGGVKVDIIVSEWMGFYLLHEGMLDSVLYARDNFLKPSGLFFPEYAMIYSAPCSFPDMYERWSSVSGVSMKSFSKKLREAASNKPETVAVKEDNLLAKGEEFAWLDLKEITLEDLKCLKNTQHTVANKAGLYQGICIWFEVCFPGEKHLPVCLSTDPSQQETHWKQTTIVLPQEIRVEEGEPIFYEITMKRDETYERRYDLELTMLDPEEVEHPEYCLCHQTKCILTRAMYKKYEEDAMTT